MARSSDGGGCQIGNHGTNLHDPIGVLLLVVIGLIGLARRAFVKS